MAELSRGANAPVTGPTLDIAVSGARQGTVDLTAFLVTADGIVRHDGDFIFFNQNVSAEGSVRLVGPDRLTVELATVPAEIERLSVAVVLDDAVLGSLAGVPGLGVTVTGPADDHRAPVSGLTSERAAVLVEIYRRQGVWKVRNVSAGWTGGFADLVRQHGVSVDDSPAPAAPTPAAPARMPTVNPSARPVPMPSVTPTAPPVPMPTAPPASVPPSPDGPRSVPGEQTLSLEKRRVLDLRKQQVHSVLLSKGVQHERVRVVMVMDKSGSMAGEYKSGTVRRVFERMVPVSIQLDDDASLEVYLYGSKFAQLPDLRVEYLDRWLDDFVHLGGTHQGIKYSKIGLANDEPAIIKHLLEGRRAGTAPTLVLFFTDGGIYKNDQISALIRTAASLPVFWQFIGIGDNNFGVLADLDTMTGRVVDNAGFFPVTDLDRIDDAELYRRLLGEFPDWLRAARAQGIVSP